jgi:hypothetical protein
VPALLGSAAAGYVAGGAATVTGLGSLVEAALAPVKAVGTAVAGASTQGVVTAGVVVTVATAGTIAMTSDFGSTAKERPAVSSPRVGASVPSTPSPHSTPSDRSDPAAPVVPTARPTPVATARTPGAAASVGRAASPPPLPPAPAAASAVEPILPTDYAIASVRVTNELTPLVQRRITISISASNKGRAAAETVTLTLAFRHPVDFGGVTSRGWSCGGAIPHRQVRTLTCTTTLAAGHGTTFVARSGNLSHSAGTIAVRAPGDPVPGNNAVSFRAGLWPLT